MEWSKSAKKWSKNAIIKVVQWWTGWPQFRMILNKKPPNNRRNNNNFWALLLWGYVFTEWPMENTPPFFVTPPHSYPSIPLTFLSSPLHPITPKSHSFQHILRINDLLLLTTHPRTSEMSVVFQWYKNNPMSSPLVSSKQHGVLSQIQSSIYCFVHTPGLSFHRKRSTFSSYPRKRIFNCNFQTYLFTHRFTLP